MVDLWLVVSVIVKIYWTYEKDYFELMSIKNIILYQSFNSHANKLEKKKVFVLYIFAQ